MDREILFQWEERIKSADAKDRMRLIHEFADTLGDDEGKIATSLLRMITMANDSESKKIERKARADLFVFGIGAFWIVLLVICAVGGILLCFHDKLAATELSIAEATIKTSSVGAVLIFIAIVGGSYVIVRAIDRLRHE